MFIDVHCHLDSLEEHEKIAKEFLDDINEKIKANLLLLKFPF